MKRFISTGAIIFLAGCSLPSWLPLVGSVSGNDLFPGNKDSLWAYEFEDAANNRRGFGTISVLNTSTSGDASFKFYNSTLNGGFDGDFSTVKATKEYLQFGGSKDAFKLKLPLSENKDLDQYKEGNKDVKVKIATKEDIIMGSTKYNAWRIDFTEAGNNGKALRSWWIAPGTGLVQVIAYDADGNKKTWQLNSYTIR